MTKVRYVGLDVHKDSIVIAVAEAGREEARELGRFPADWHALEKALKKLARGGRTLEICYEAGPTGYELYRRLLVAGYGAQVVAPSLVPQKVGQRFKTDRRDAMKLAQEIAGMSPDAVRAAKRLFNESGLGSVQEGFVLESELQKKLIGSPKQAEAVRANLEKRAPNFEDPK